MELSLSKRTWIHILIAGLGSAVLYRVGIYGFLYLVPLYYGFIMGGLTVWAWGALLFAGASMVSGLIVGIDGGFLFTDLLASVVATALVPISSLSTLRRADSTAELRGGPSSFVDLAALAATSYGAALILLFVFGDQIASIQAQIEQGMAQADVYGDLLADLPEMLKSFAGPSIMIFVLLNRGVGHLVARLTQRRVPDFSQRLRVPKVYLWIFSGTALLNALVILADAQGLRPWLLGALIVSAMVYGFQGIKIAGWVGHKRSGLRNVETTASALFLLGLAIPAISLILGVGLVLLGISEHWVDFKRFPPLQSNESQEVEQ